MKIRVGDDYEATIDKEDFPKVRGFDWNPLRTNDHVYAQAPCEGATVLMHRLIINAKPGEVVIHVNGDHMDNRMENLRIVSKSVSNSRRKLNANSKSGVKGVLVENCHGRKRYRGNVLRDGKRLRKWFDSLEAAASWVKSTRDEVWGES